eukprot:363560-Chlamydomonas_euryale.AAC.8
MTIFFTSKSRQENRALGTAPAALTQGARQAAAALHWHRPPRCRAQHAAACSRCPTAAAPAPSTVPHPRPRPSPRPSPAWRERAW